MRNLSNAFPSYFSVFFGRFRTVHNQRDDVTKVARQRLVTSEACQHWPKSEEGRMAMERKPVGHSVGKRSTPARRGYEAEGGWQ